MNNTFALPNLFILGAAKSGTTSIYNILSQHSKVSFPFIKEPLFFSRDDFYSRGLNWYANEFFDPIANMPIRGEASPHYLYWAEKVAPRIKKIDDGNIKFVVIFRNPVDRAYSWFWNMVSNGMENLTFENALDAETGRLQKNVSQLQSAGKMTFGYKKGGHYASQIKQYLQLFPREQFYFLLFDDLKDKNELHIRGLYDFLNIEAPKNNLNVDINPSSQPRIRSLNRYLYELPPLISGLKRIMPLKLRSALLTAIKRANKKSVDYPPMPSATVRILTEYFREEINELEGLIDRNLSHWKKGKREKS